MEFIKKNILITGFITFLVVALGVSVYLTQKQTQLKSRAAGPTGTCNSDNTFCLWFDTLTPDQPTEGKDLYVFVAGKNGDTEVKITGDFNSSSADTSSGASCGSGDFATCWKFKIGGSQVTSGAKNVIFKSTQAPDGRVGGWVTILSAAPPPVAALPPSSGSVSVASSSVTRQTDGSWQAIRINTNVNVAGADNSKTVAGVYVNKTTNVASGNGWVAINKFYGTNTNEPDSFDYQLPGTFPAGSYTYGLFQMDNSTVVNQLGVSSPVTYQDSSGGGNPPGGGASGSDAGDCQVVSIEGQDLKDFPGLVVNNQYRVSIIMSNTRVSNVTTNDWQPDYTIRYGGGPVSQEKLGITNAQLKIGQTVKVGDTYPFTVLIKPVSAGTYPFIWQLYNVNGDPFGGRCNPGFIVFNTLPGTQTPPPGSTPPPGGTPAPSAQVQFRVANGDTYELAVAGLDGATWTNFSPTANSTFMLSPVTLTNPQPGKAKSVALQFKKGDAIDNNIVVKSIMYLGAPPAITGSLSCEYTADGASTRVTINGQNLGAAGSVMNNSSLAYKIESWDQNKISALFTGKIQGQFPVKVTTDQGQIVSSTCQVGLTTINFSLATTCSNIEQGGYNADNVKIKIYKNSSDADVSAPFVSQTIRVTAGQVQSFNPSLVANRDYSMLIKAPKSPQKRIDFHTQIGTTDLGTITLRIGDIAPLNSPDGDGFISINDFSLLYREWSIDKDVSTIGDIAGNDSRVNSLDYSCMKTNFDNNKGNETFSPPANTGNTGSSGAAAGSGGSNTVSISTKGRVFLDANANKLYDSGETLYPNVTVQLLKVPDTHVVGQPLNSNEIAQSTIFTQATTDANGAFAINFNAVNQNLKLSFYVPAATGTNNSPGQVDGYGTLQSLNNLSTNIQLGGIDIPVPYVGTLNMNVSQL